MTYCVPPSVPNQAPSTWRARLIGIGTVVLLLLYLALPFLVFVFNATRLGDSVTTQAVHVVSGVAIFGGIIVQILLIPYAIYTDISLVRTRSTWDPRQWVYTLSAALLPVLISAYYLYKRYQAVGSPLIPGHKHLNLNEASVDSNWWVFGLVSWLALPLSLATVRLWRTAIPSPDATISVGTVTLLWPLFLITLFTLSVRVTLLPVGIYFDAKAVRDTPSAEAKWEPSPVFWAITAGLVATIAMPYYLWRRRDTIPGLSSLLPSESPG